MTIQLLVTDQNLTILGDPLDDWLSLDVTRRFNAPATGTVALPAHPDTMNLLQPGNRLVVVRDGEIWCAGPLEEPQVFEWAVDGEQDPGKVTANFTDDLGRIAGYLTYPNPAVSFTAQDSSVDKSYTPTAGAAGTLLLDMVNKNCGPSALTARRVPNLAFGTGTGLGSSTTITTRFEPLLDACRRLAATDGLGFRTRQADPSVVFEAYVPTDRTATARFSAGLGNLRKVSFTMGAPLATAELVQGGTADSTASPATFREYVEVGNATAEADWYRVEKLVDESGKYNTSGELTQAAVLAFGNDNPQASLSTETIDTDDLRAGRDFDLGDLVTVELPTGLEVADIVQGIQLQATPEAGELVTTMVGQSDETTALQTVRVVRDLARRLGRLEAR